MTTDDELDAHLRAAFTPPAAAAFTRLGERVVRRPAWPRLLPLLVAAAAVLIVGWLGWSRIARPAPDGRELGALWAAAYEHARAEGFRGGACCDRSTDLSALCRDCCGNALRVRDAADLTLLGAYSGLPTGGCTTLLADHGGSPICVCVVPRARDVPVELPAASRLQLARRELGDVVLYALGDASPATALEHFLLAP